MENSLKNTIFSFFDTETTGDNSKKDDKPIEVAIVKWSFDKGIIEPPKSWLINPQKYIHPSAIAVHGLTDDDVKDAPLLDEINPQLINYIGDNPMVAHNINFDLDMLPVLKESNNLKIDTLRVAKHVYKIGDLNKKGLDLRSNKMQELRFWLDIKVDTMGLSAHRASADILVNAYVFKEMINKYLEITNGNDSLSDFIEYIESPVLLEKMPFGKFYGESILESLKKEQFNSKNYFTWLDDQVKNNKMQIDTDLQYSLDYYKSQLKSQNLKKF